MQIYLFLYLNTQKIPDIVFSYKNDVKSHLSMCMVTRGHFIIIKFFFWVNRGQRQGHRGPVLIPFSPWHRPCLEFRLRFEKSFGRRPQIWVLFQDVLLFYLHAVPWLPRWQNRCCRASRELCLNYLSRIDGLSLSMLSLAGSIHATHLLDLHESSAEIPALYTSGRCETERGSAAAIEHHSA